MNIETTELAPANDAQLIVKYSVTEEDILATKARYASITFDTPSGYEEGRKAIAHIRATRVEVERRRVELKASSLAFGRRVDAVAKHFTELLEGIEEPLKLLKAAVDEEKERVKAEAEAAKKRELEAKLRAEREAEEAMLRAEREAEEQRLREERARLDAERAELEAQRRAADEKAKAERAAEDARRAEEQRKADEAARIEREKLEAERAQLAEERRAVEEARQKAERAEFERQARIKAEEEAKAKAERDRIAAEEARIAELERKADEQRRLEALRPDVEKLRAFAASLRALPRPSLTTEAARAELDSANVGLESIALDIEAFGMPPALVSETDDFPDGF